MRLAEAFYGTQIGSDARLSLEHYSVSTGQPIDLVSLDVRISGAMVGGTSSTVNRKIEDYINNVSIVNAFLSGFKGYTSTTASTNALGGGSTRVVNTININTTTT
jgi:hypothetical protein